MGGNFLCLGGNFVNFDDPETRDKIRFKIGLINFQYRQIIGRQT